MRQCSFAAAEKIFTIMDMAPEITDREEAAEAADSDIYSAAVTDAKMDADAGSDADTDSGADTNTNTNTPADKGGLIELETLRGEIEFQDVWFCYNPGEWVLKGVSFHIYPGQTAPLSVRQVPENRPFCL